MTTIRYHLIDLLDWFRFHTIGIAALVAPALVSLALGAAFLRAIDQSTPALAVPTPALRPFILVATPTAAPVPTVEALPAPVVEPIAVPEQPPVVEPVAPVVVFDLPAAPVELAVPTPAPEWIATVESHEAGATKNSHAVPAGDWCSGVHLANTECAGAP